jgi:hypothetical protein
VATRVVELYDPEFNPIVARIEREIASLKGAERLRTANRRLKLSLPDFRS